MNSSRTITIIMFIQFINMCDFMMVMPLGPDYIQALNIRGEQIGIITSSYSIAASIVGIIASLFIDRYDRKKAILLCLSGLIIATFLASFAFDLYSMATTRVIAGAFGGPLSALSLAMITDTTSTQERGFAMGKAIGGFSMAAFFGVPFGLELSQWLGWKSPFIALSLAALIVLYQAHKYLPDHCNERVHNNIKNSLKRLVDIAARKLSMSAMSILCCSLIGMFLLVPNIATHFQFNLGFPREYLSLLYCLGGVSSFIATRIAGKIIDRYGLVVVMISASLLMLFTLYFGFIAYPSIIPASAIFICMMTASYIRNLSIQTLSSKIPGESERGSYFSINNMVQNLSAATGAYLSSTMLTQTGDQLLGVEKVGTYAFILALILPIIFINTNNLLKKRDQSIVLPIID